MHYVLFNFFLLCYLHLSESLDTELNSDIIYILILVKKWSNRRILVIYIRI